METLSRRKFLGASVSMLSLAACGGGDADHGSAPDGSRPAGDAGTGSTTTDPIGGTDAGPRGAGEMGLRELSRAWPRSYARMASEDQELDLKLLAGKLPGDMYGHVFINGPIPRGTGGHPFNGDGMVRRLDFGASTVRYHEDLVTTRLADLYENHPYRKVAIADLPKTGKPANLFRVDAATMELRDGYEYPTGRIMGSPTFVPRMGKSGPTEGYVVALMISDDSAQADSTGDEIWIFDAANLQAGPLCRLGHAELNLGFTIHTTWLEELKPAPRDHVIPVREDYAKAYADADDKMKKVLDEQVFPHFE